jgi:transcriptional antiterminator NusG
MNTTMEKQTTTGMKWYIVRSQSNREKSVSERLIKESEKGDLIGKLGRVIVPMEKSFFLKNGKKVMREKVTFPGYIFVETNSIGELKYSLKGINGATGFLTNRAGDILPLSNSEVDNMLGKHEKSKEVEPENTFVVGEEIKVLDGPFSGFNGVIDEIVGKKVKVSVLIFGRKTPMDLNILQIGRKE